MLGGWPNKQLLFFLKLKFGQEEEEEEEEEEERERCFSAFDRSDASEWSAQD